MSSSTDICNMAIANLGSSATVNNIDPPDGSALAAKCAIFYPMMRDALIEMRDWPFAIKRVALNELSGVTIPAPYTHAYGMPSEALTPVDIRHSEASDDSKPNRLYWEVQADGSRVVFTDTESAVMRYKFRQQDSTKYTPLFVRSLTWLIAGSLVGSLKGGDVKEMQRCEGMFQATLGAAAAATFKVVNAPIDHTPSWIGAR